ncbi:MAG: hypothetical protein HN736_03975 [Anaerolineae bacterium]|jgi:hypothetical protein|nr:hypothetical protein [Anaerolineae bacterium]MBT3713686.1 hypothetical protein [Anaerolineae bacterium]MBT4309071.1 hypothetical protein [Anaerolineae bacterium]MBT4457550.1 hypothetical protein [Anaerolineae bacterium]MBT4841433.1 hypothetical protein [Anaerolineae bacterium]
MSDAFWGVILGGLIGISGTITAIIFQHKQWKTNRRLEHLQKKRDLLVEDFESFAEKLKIKEGSEIQFDDIVSDMYLRIPKGTFIGIDMMNDYGDLKIPKNWEKLQTALTLRMSEYLAKLDAEIDELTK